MKWDLSGWWGQWREDNRTSFCRELASAERGLPCYFKNRHCLACLGLNWQKLQFLVSHFLSSYLSLPLSLPVCLLVFFSCFPSSTEFLIFLILQWSLPWPWPKPLLLGELLRKVRRPRTPTPWQPLCLGPLKSRFVRSPGRAWGTLLGLSAHTVRTARNWHKGYAHKFSCLIYTTLMSLVK